MSSHLLIWTAGAATGFVAAVAMLRARRAVSVSTVLALGWAWAGLLIGAKWQYQLEQFPLTGALWLSPGEVLEPGLRLPLGLLVGGMLAGLWCLAVGAPWRATGDALAVAASAMMPIGRIGCLVNGCCMGAVCGRFAAFCLRYPPGSEAYTAQLSDDLIPASAPLSLPAHPLPLYFAASSLVILGVLLWLYRRGAPQGALLATFCILEPLVKLMLEPLRATPRPPALMVGIPLSVLTVSSIVLVAKYRRIVAARRSAVARPAAIAPLLIAFTSTSAGASVVSDASGACRSGKYRLGGDRT